MASNNGVFPELVLDIGPSTTRPTGATTASPLGALVENTLRAVLGWRPRPNDPKGFLAALNQSFTISDMQGHTEFTWTPHSYAIQADMGAVTGAQASIYARAKAALDQSVPLLEGLFPLRSDDDEEDIEAIRAVVINKFTELVNELGTVGGPRIPRVDDYFTSLLGPGKQDNPEIVSGLFGQMRSELGLDRTLVNTIDEEQNLTNYLIVVDHVISLRRSWENLKHFFDHTGTDVFLGTQLVEISRALGVVVESVQELYFVLDSVFLGAAERQTVRLDTNLTIDELFSWVERFASEEAPRLIREGGKDGVIAFRSTIETLSELVTKAFEQANGNNNNPQVGFHHPRTVAALKEVNQHVDRVADLAGQLKRGPALRILVVEPASTSRGTDVTIIVDGENFQPGATVYLTEWEERKRTIFAKRVILIGTSELKTIFDLTQTMGNNKWAVVVKNPDGERAFAPEPFWIDEDGPEIEPPRVDDIEPDGAPNTGRITLKITGINFDPGADVTLTRDDATSIKGTNTHFSEDGTEIDATFNLKNKLAGEWRVQVANPDGTPALPWEFFTISLPPTIDSATVMIGSEQNDLVIQGGNFLDNASITLFPPRGQGDPVSFSPLDITIDPTEITADLDTLVVNSRWTVQVINGDGGTSKRHAIVVTTVGE